MKEFLKYKMWIVIGAWLIIIGFAQASTPVIWEQYSQRDFQNGEPSNISIASQGYLRLAPSINALFETSEPLVWCLATDARGNVYAGTGNDGKLFKIDGSGRGTLVFDAKELEIHSIAVDGTDHIFVATFPDGKIYRITPDGQSSVFFDPAVIGSGDDPTNTVDRYIWSLTLDDAGNLYAGTGDRGRIYKIDRSGKASVLVETEETHIVALAIDPAGRLIAGSEPNGRIYRVTPAGQMTVLYDAPQQEIHALIVDDSGMIYASAIDEPRRFQGRAAQPASPSNNRGSSGPQASGGVIEVTAPAVNGARPATSFRPSLSDGGGVVYQIRPDGVVQKWWESQEDVSLALAFHENGSLLVGTGPRGIVYAIGERGQSTTLAQIQESQITAFGTLKDNQIAIASSNLGKVYRMGQTPVRKGTFESEIKDTGGASSWGRIGWVGERPNGTSVQFYTRTGNTDTPDKTWSSWSGPYTKITGEAITSPSARFIQWKAVLETKNTTTPIVSSVSVAYLTRNVAPVVNRVTVYEAGVYLRETSNNDTGRQDLPPKVSSQINGNRSGSRNRSASSGIPTFRKGMRAVAIDAMDVNNDDLAYEVYFRGQNETQWKLLRDNLKTPSYSWDSETLPDGMYTVKVVVSDAPSNPPNLALITELESDPFLIDNIAPQVKKIVTARRNPHQTLTFTVEDAASPLYKVEYAIDGGGWWVIYPDDGVADSMMETFELSLTDLETGEHTIAIRAKDISNNIGSGKQVITVP